jgi:hypothetical protein
MEFVQEDALPEDWESKALVITNAAKEPVGITREGVNYVIEHLEMYKEPWVANILIVSNTPAKYYMLRMKSQVNAIADLHHALLVSLIRKDVVPIFTAPLEEKLVWGMEHVKSLQTISTDTVFEWISQGIGKIEKN